jgi:DNA primase
MTTKFVDFKEVKESVSIETAITLLGLTMRRQGEAFRSGCPTCRAGGDRALVVTPAKGTFYCFGKKTGGDVIALAAHVKQIGMKDAAMLLAESYSLQTEPYSRQGGEPSPRNSSQGVRQEVVGMKPLEYLEAVHDAVQALGLDGEFCKEAGIGYAPKGTMRGRVLFPVRNRQGILLGYAGMAADEKSQPRMMLPSNLDPRTVIYGEDKVQEGELRIAPDPLEAALAQQHGVQAIAFLSEAVPSEQLDILVSLMDARKAELVF